MSALTEDPGDGMPAWRGPGKEKRDSRGCQYPVKVHIDAMTTVSFLRQFAAALPARRGRVVAMPCCGGFAFLARVRPCHYHFAVLRLALAAGAAPGAGAAVCDSADPAECPIADLRDPSGLRCGMTACRTAHQPG
jgi:hypothetical protein